MHKLAGKFKYDWLVPDRYGSIYDETGFRWFISALISFMPLGFGVLLIIFESLAAIGIPLMVIGIIILSFGAFGGQMPKLHYLYGMGTSQRKAIKWYEELSEIEKRQLPKGWVNLIRESGADEIQDSEVSWRTSTVAMIMLEDAAEVIRLYRESKEQPKIPDYRINVYRELMQSRAQELRNEIEDRKAIEEKIASMP